MRANDMANREKDRLVEELIFGKVPCTGWKRFNFGSAGGPALRKECDHGPEDCYPDVEIGAGAFGGTIGGPQKYTSSLKCTIEMLEFLRDHRDAQWMAQLIDRMNDEFAPDAGLARLLVYDPDCLPERIVDLVLDLFQPSDHT